MESSAGFREVAVVGAEDAAMLATGAAYLRCVGPTYGFFGLGLSLYFASQGAGKLGWPLIAGLLRMAIAAGGGALALRWTGSLTAVFVMLAAALVSYGIVAAAAIVSGSWFRPGFGIALGPGQLGRPPRRASLPLR